jgi:hypothetical protein
MRIWPLFLFVSREQVAVAEQINKSIQQLAEMIAFFMIGDDAPAQLPNVSPDTASQRETSSLEYRDTSVTDHSKSAGNPGAKADDDSIDNDYETF